MGKKGFSLLTVLVFILVLVLPAAVLAERPVPETVPGEKYISGWLPGASALYVSGEQVTLDNAYFYGAGYASDQEITDQIPNQYGLCSVVLGAGQGTEIVLNSPTIVSDPESYANGVFAAAMAKVTVNGGTIDTDNSSGHGIDATYMGHVYATDTVIHTRGETSGALATDFGGGFISAERLDCTTEGGSSPGIFCAGSTVILLKDSVLTTQKATGVVVAHDHAVVVLDNCKVDAAGTALSGLQALPNAASSDGSSCYVFGGELTSRSGAVVGESGGRTVVNLVSVQCTAGGDTAISASGRSAGILTVNLWDTVLTGGIECGKDCSVTVNLYAGSKLAGEVSGEGTVVINVFDGGAYEGSFTANASGAGEAAPVPGTFDDYLVSCWATGSSTWTESRAQQYVTNVEPAILENSAACLTSGNAAAKAYDPAVYNPSETGVDLSLLNVGGAHGFTVDEIFGGGSGMPSGMPEGFEGSSGAPAGDFDFGESSGAPAGSTEAPAAEEEAAPSADTGVISVILNTGTTQAFSDREVPDEDLEMILKSGLSAASAINQQPWFFAAVSDPDVIAEISGSGASAGVPAGAPAGDFGESSGAPAGTPAGGDFAASSGAPAGGDFAPSSGAPAGGGSAAKAGLGDSPVAIIIYRNDKSSSPNADFDCGLATQNMVIAASSLGYGVKIISSPTMTLNGANHDAICAKLGVDPSLQAVAVLLIGTPDESVDAVSGASTRETLETRTVIIK